MKRLGLRWLKFNFVGAVGFAVQLAALKLLLLGHLNYLVATALAVETAVLHNFAWHERFTWKDRPGGGRERLMRLVRFHLGNGLFSILANLAIMWVLVSRLHMTHLVLANAIAVAVCSVLNFAIGEWYVFRE